MFKPIEYNLDMRDPDNWHEVCRNQPKDIIAYIPGANLHEQELLDGATSIGKLYSPKKAGFWFGSIASIKRQNRQRNQREFLHSSAQR